jgi:hypothetical protein
MTSSIISHVFKGISGWSYWKLNCVDVSKVESVMYKKRLFKLFDRQYDYTLSIHYYLQDAFRSKTLVEITKRYKTEKEIIDEIYEITNKKKITEYVIMK